MRTMRSFSVLLLCLLGSIVSIEPVFAQRFSIDAASPSVPGVSNSDLLSPGSPGVATPAAALGLAGGGIDELDALTTGSEGGWLFSDLLIFSVDRASVGDAGTPPDVASEAAVGQEAGDLYVTYLTDELDSNQLDINQHLLGEIPLVLPGVVAAGSIDNLDALDFYHSPNTLFSLKTGHPYAGSAVGCGGDLFAPGPALAISYFTLGLAACSDDVDALQLDSMTGDIYLSLAPGSISLGPVPPSPIIGCAAGCGPADIFVAAGGVGALTVVAPSAKLGLLPTDNVDGIAFPVAIDSPALGGLSIAVLIVMLISTACVSILSTRRQRATPR